MKLTPLIRLQAANRRWELAQQECAHWDEESDPPEYGNSCCEEFHDAREERRKAVRAWKEYAYKGEL